MLLWRKISLSVWALRVSWCEHVTSLQCDTVRLVIITNTRDRLRQRRHIIVEDREDYLTTPRQKKALASTDIDRTDGQTRT